MALWFFGERIGLWGWLGLSLGIIGISLLGLPDEWIISFVTSGSLASELQLGTGLLEDLFQNGQWLMLLAALSMAVGTVMMRVVSRYADPITATGWHMVLGGLPLFALSSQLETNQWSQLDWSNWLAMGYSTVFGSAIAYGLFFYFASSGSLTSLSSLTFLTPVFALLFGNLFLSETLSPIQCAGVFLTLLSIYLINQRDAIAQKLNPHHPVATVEVNGLASDEKAAIDFTQVPVHLTESE
jgi:drug/metabolite transporter (DMT)-like permease